MRNFFTSVFGVSLSLVVGLMVVTGFIRQQAPVTNLCGDSSGPVCIGTANTTLPITFMPALTPTVRLTPTTMIPVTDAVVALGDSTHRFTTASFSTGVTSASVTLTSLAASSTAPTIASGGCTSPAVTWNNGTAAFKLTLGSSCTGVKTITLTLPAATNGWVCTANDVTTPASNVVAEHSSNTTTVVLGNYARTTGLAADFTAAEVVLVSCLGG